MNGGGEEGGLNGEEEEEERNEEEEEIRKTREERERKFGGIVSAAPYSGIPSRMEDAVGRYVEAIKNEIVKKMRKNPGDNMTHDQREAMGQMAEKVKRGEWAIRPADKGGGISVEKIQCVIEDGRKELDSVDTYKELEKRSMKTTERKIKEKLMEMSRKGAITEKMRKEMQPKNTRQGQMKINRKLHKPLNEEGRYPWRAYMSGIGTTTESIAGLVEHELNDGVEKLPSYVEDTSDFLRRIEGLKLEEDEFLFTMDVEKLYPSVPREGGRTAMRENLDSRKDKTIPTEDLMELAEMVLQKK